MSVVFKNIIRDHKLSHKLIPVFNVAPELELACSRVAEFVGERFRGDKGPLAAEMIESALSGFKRAKRTGDQHVAFMQGLFEPSKSLYARRYVARRGEKLAVWSPMLEAFRRSKSATRAASSRRSMNGVPNRSPSAPPLFNWPLACFKAKRSVATSRNTMSLDRYDHSEVVGG